MLLAQPDADDGPLGQQFGAYVAEIDIETVDGQVSSLVGICHGLSGHFVRSGHAEEVSGGFGSTDICPLIQIGLQPAGAYCGGADAAVL